MLNIEKHIEELLFQYDCVIVPNLGGFVANIISADYNEKTGVFNPPVREIGFNRSLSHNDGLLINYIAGTESISYETCQSKLSEHVNILKSQIYRGEVVNLKNIGELKADSMGNIVFIRSKTNAFSTTSFGLSTFHFNTILQEKEKNEISRRFLRRTVSSNKSIRSVAASVALIFGLLLISPNLHRDSQQSNFSDILSEMNFTNPVPASEDNVISVYKEETKEDRSLSVEENTVNEVTETEEFVNDPVEAEVVVDNHYFIIAGSFNQLTPANQFLKKVLNQGVAGAEILEADKGRYRVALEGFEGKEEALNALMSYRDQKGFKTAWLLSK